MRTRTAVLGVASAMVLASGMASPRPAYGQAGGIVRFRPDSSRTFEFIGQVTAREVLELASKLSTLRERERTLQTELGAAREAARAALLREELMRVVSDLPSLQSKLALSCLALRSSRPARDGYLGVTPARTLTAREVRPGVQLIEPADGPVRIEVVEAGSPAEQAGMRVGDEWLTLGEREVVRVTESDLDELLQPGARLPVTVRRDGRTIRTQVTVGRWPAFPEDACGPSGMFAFSFDMAAPPSVVAGRVNPRSAPPAGGVGAGPMPRVAMPQAGQVIAISPTRVTVYGVTVKTLDRATREFLEVSGEALLVDEVLPGTPAERAGLRRYDVIHRVNGNAIAMPMELLRVSSTERVLTLEVSYKGEKRTVTLSRQ